MEPHRGGTGLYRFGVFGLDLEAGELRKKRIKVKLQELPLQILVLLPERPGPLWTRDELRQRLWTDDMHIWAESYELDIKDILALQADVATAIVRETRTKLSPQREARLATNQPLNEDACEAYLKGRYHWNRMSGEDLKRVVANYEHAIAREPKFAAAHAGLADCH